MYVKSVRVYVWNSTYEARSNLIKFAKTEKKKRKKEKSSFQETKNK